MEEEGGEKKGKRKKNRRGPEAGEGEDGGAEPDVVTETQMVWQLFCSRVCVCSLVAGYSLAARVAVSAV